MLAGDNSGQRWRLGANGVAALAGLAGLGLLVYEIGFVLTATTQARVLAVATFVLWLGVAGEAAGAALAWASGKRR